MIKDMIILKWNDIEQKYEVNRIGTFIDYKENEFTSTETIFFTEKSIADILNFLHPWEEKIYEDE